MNDQLFSIRMRASVNNRHLSGAERLAPAEYADKVIRQLAERAVNRTMKPDTIAISVDPVERGSVTLVNALAVTSCAVPNKEEGRSLALQLLECAGVAGHAARAAIHILAGGASPFKENMRGAVIMDAQNAARLEPDRERGIRVSRFDWTESGFQEAQSSLASLGLTHSRTIEAVALASKVAHAPGIIAELCWSDEPDYSAGYVSSGRFGYVRISVMKDIGDSYGGRVFFVDSAKTRLDAFISHLQYDAMLIDKNSSCRIMDSHALLSELRRQNTYV